MEMHMKCLTFSSIFCHTCLHRMMTMMATRMKMMATKQPIRIRVLLSSTLWVGSSSRGGNRERHLFKMETTHLNLELYIYI